MKSRVTVVGVALVLSGAPGIPIVLEAQIWPGVEGRWPGQPVSGVGRIVAPFLEGWYENEDGTFSYSFGYSNLNEEVVEIPLGERNLIEPAEYQGMQPTTFLPGKNRGMFAVTVPASMTEDVWWTIINAQGEVARVPGRRVWNAYQLDWLPRPHGSVPPRVSFDGGEAGRGPPGVTLERTLATTVGSPLTLTVDVEEISVRDPTDYRFSEPTSLRVVWSKYQGPVGAQIAFSRHESTPIPEERPSGGDGNGGGERPGPETIMVPSGEGTVSVVATFSEPGEYVLNAQVDSWRAPDSSEGTQCCWTNAYVRVTVGPRS